MKKMLKNLISFYTIYFLLIIYNLNSYFFIIDCVINFHCFPYFVFLTFGIVLHFLLFRDNILHVKENYMKSHREQVKQYNKKLKEWKQQRSNIIKKSDDYLQQRLGVEFDIRLTKGTMYKSLYSDYTHGSVRGFYLALDDPEKYREFFTPPSEIVEVQIIQKLKQRREQAQKSGELEKVKKYDHVISIEIGKFKHSAPEANISRESLEILGINLRTINEIRIKNLQCNHTLHYIITCHPWFKQILEELAEVGNRCPEAPEEVKKLRTEYDDLLFQRDYIKNHNKDEGIKEIKYTDLNPTCSQFNKIRVKTA